METRFTWDPAKAQRNQRDHGISFAMAREVFADPNHVVTENYRFEDEGEQPWGSPKTGQLGSPQNRPVETVI
jgi:uncharacterized DUF497 family protein